MNKGIHPSTIIDLGDGMSVPAVDVREGMQVMSIAGRDARPRVLERLEAGKSGMSVTLHFAGGSVTVAPDQEIGVLFNGKRVWIRAAYIYPGVKVFTYSSGLIGNCQITSVEKRPESSPMIYCRVRGDAHCYFAGGLLCR